MFFRGCTYPFCKRVLVAAILLVLVTLSAGVMVFCYDVGGVFKGVLERKAGSYLRVPVSVGSVRMNPFAGTVTVHDLKLLNPRGYFTDSEYMLNIKNFDISIDVPSLFSRHVKIKNVMMDDVDLQLGFRGASSNYQKVMKRIRRNVKSKEAAYEEGSKKHKKASTVAIENLEIINLHVHTRASVLEANFTIDKIALNNIGGENALPQKAILSVMAQLYQKMLKSGIRHPGIDLDKTVKNLKESLKKSIKEGEGSIKEIIK